MGISPFTDGRGPGRVAVLATAILLLGPALSGCLGAIDDSVGDDDLDLTGDGADAGSTGDLRVFVQAVDVGDYDSAETTVADVEAAPAVGENVSLEAPDGHVDLASQDPVLVGSGDVALGEYGSVAFTLTDIHGTYDGEDYEISELDRRVHAGAGVPVEEGSTTTLILGIDLAAADDPSTGFDPTFTTLGARLDGEAIDLPEENTGPAGEPPVARAEVFNGTGVKIYESDFEAPGGEAEAVAKHETITWTARPSEDPDGTVTSYEWSFSDGASASGKTVNHAFHTGGIHAATLTVTDDRGNEDTLTVEVPVRYLVSEDGEDLFDGNASGSFTAGGDDVAPGAAQEETRREHTFEIAEIEHTSSNASDGSGSDDETDEDTRAPDTSIPVHGGGHGAGDVEDPEKARRLAATTFNLTWENPDYVYTLEVSREGETLAEETGDNGSVEVELQQIDGWYMDGGNYTTEVQYDQGAGGEYEVDVTGTYIPVPH